MTTIDHPQAKICVKTNVDLSEGPNLPLTNMSLKTTSCASAAPNLDIDHAQHEAQVELVGVDQATGSDQARTETQKSRVATGQTSSDGQNGHDNQDLVAAAGTMEEGLGHTLFETQRPDAEPLLHSPILALAAEIVDDLERVRNANQNRLRQLTRVGVDKDGEERGFGLDLDNLDVLRLQKLVKHLSDAYDESVKNLEKVMRAHPLGPWVKKTAGLGDKQTARLLAAIGDPYWHLVEERPRTVSELWAYSGYHVIGGHAADHETSEAQKSTVGGVAPRRQKGKKLNWSQAARMRAHLIAESCLKAKTSPYNPVYYQTREKYAEAVHNHPCAPCGTKGKPAAIGTPLKDGHKHARALRAVAKEVLKGLWIESKHLHELQISPTMT